MGQPNQRQALDTKTWPEGKTFETGGENIIQEPLLLIDKVVYPPLHVKLGLMKQYAKVLDKDENCFKYLCSTFPGLSEEKLKAGILDDAKI